MAHDFISIYCVFSSHDEAERIARHLLQKRLVACANILPAGHSMYWWKGHLETASEHYALFKTESKKFALVEKEILKHHSYDVPCIVALPIAAGHAPYLEWIVKETAAG